MKKKTGGQPKPNDLWPDVLPDSLAFCNYLIVNQIRRMAEEDFRPGKPHPMIAGIHVLRVLLEGLPAWPRNRHLRRTELLRWCQLIRDDMDNATKLVPKARRAEFEQRVNSDLDFLTEYIERKWDKKVDITLD